MIKSQREKELIQYSDTGINALNINTRIRNILIQNKIEKLVQLVDVLDSGLHLEGLGDKSVKVLKGIVESLGIRLYSVNDDINFVFRYFCINYDANAFDNITEINRILSLPFNTFGWHMSRIDLKKFIDNQCDIAKYLKEKFSGDNQGVLQCMGHLRKDSETIYIPGQYFFREVDIHTTRFQ